MRSNAIRWYMVYFNRPLDTMSHRNLELPLCLYMRDTDRQADTERLRLNSQYVLKILKRIQWSLTTCRVASPNTSCPQALQDYFILEVI